MIDDAEADWGYEHNPFDFVHGRSLELSIKDMPRLIGQAYKYARPGPNRALGLFKISGPLISNVAIVA